MVTSPSELRGKHAAPKPPTRNLVWAAIAIIGIVAIGAFLIFGRGPGEKKKPGDQSIVSTRAALDKLYTEAQSDLRKKKYLDAAAKFKQLANMDPGFRDAIAQAKAAAALLLKEAVQDIKSGNLEEAKKKLEVVQAVDPTNTDAKKKLNDVKKKTHDKKPSPPPATGDTLRPIAGDATGDSLLPQEISGYETVQRGKIANTKQDYGATFIPSSPQLRTQIDRVLVTVAKYDTGQMAKDRFDDTKSGWPLEGQTVRINGHDVYAGIYDFGDSIYKTRQMAIYLWTRDKWYFSIEVLPKGTPASAYKKGIARDIAVKWGY